MLLGRTKKEALSHLYSNEDVRTRKVAKYMVCPGCGEKLVPQRLNWKKHYGRFRAEMRCKIHTRNRKAEKEQPLREEPEKPYWSGVMDRTSRFGRLESLAYAAICLFFLGCGVWLFSHPDFLTRLFASYLGIPLFGFGFVMFVSRLISKQC